MSDDEANKKANELYREELNKVISRTLEQLAMIHYDKEIKGCLILVIDNNNVFRLMEAYGSDTALAMNGAIDIAKDNVITAMKRSLTQAQDK